MCAGRVATRQPCARERDSHPRSIARAVASRAHNGGTMYRKLRSSSVFLGWWQGRDCVHPLRVLVGHENIHISNLVNARTREISRKLRDSSISSSGREGSIDRNFDKKLSKFEVTCHIWQLCEIEQLVEGNGSFWHAPASRWHRPLRSLGIARHRMASLGTSRHPDGTSRRRGGHGRRGAWRRV